MTENLQGPGWAIVRPRPAVDHAAALQVDQLIPEAEWFWSALEHYCAAGCCGIEAFDFTARSVLWACGVGDEPPPSGGHRYLEIEDPPALAAAFRRAIVEIRKSDAEAAGSSRLNEWSTPEFFARLLDSIASTIESVDMWPDART